MKTCKNCQLWRPYRGQETTMPARSSHACLLRLREREITNEKGEKERVLVPTLQEHDSTKGPRWGQRTHPKDHCQYIVPKHSPKVDAITIASAVAPKVAETLGSPDAS